MNALGLAEFPAGKGKGKGAGKHGGGKQGGKGPGKSLEAKTNDGGEFQCKWDDCQAARRQQTTWGGKKTCHCCGRPKGQALNPPLESLAEWAYQSKIEAASKRPTGDVPKKEGKGKAKGGGKDAQAADKKPDEVRQTRIAAFKEAEAKQKQANAGAAKKGGDNPAVAPAPARTAAVDKPQPPPLGGRGPDLAAADVAPMEISSPTLATQAEIEALAKKLTKPRELKDGWSAAAEVDGLPAANAATSLAAHTKVRQGDPAGH